MPIDFVDKKMSRSWRQICFYLVLIAIIYSFVSAEDTLRLCGQQLEHTRSLVFVNTLDGKISALDAANNGQILWTLEPPDGPMLSSSIHRKELNNNGQWVRLIPSLNGGLYKFDGENLETVPLSADQLLHSSFHFSNDLVFSGGKELHSYGVVVDTGEILYDCKVSECNNNTDHQYEDRDVLIIQRFQQTVRAVAARTGSERWNFSVGQYDLELIPSDVSCSDKDTALDIKINVVIPEGLIWAVDTNNPNIKLWQHKFDSPIVKIWREDASRISIASGPLEKVDLFDGSQWIWGSEYSTIRPSLYIGMHERQLYVQESHSDRNLFDLKHGQHIKYPWQPYPATATAIINTVPNEDDSNEASTKSNETQNAIALSVLYNSEYINGNGFYLYSSDQLTNNKQCNHSNSDNLLISTKKPMLTYTQEDNVVPAQVVMSIWYWWREVLVFTITTAFLLNFMSRSFNITASIKATVLPPPIIEGHIETKKSDITNNDDENVNNFKSRFLTDFEPIDCLGKGGYGVVFEARNKIDDCKYAIKRIALPNSQDSRERVMREVKALAKLDHANIVRYFNAWLECPPGGWQEEHDQQWTDKLKCSTDFFSEITQTETKPNYSVYIDVSQTQSSVESACDALNLNNVNGNDDSYITFERSNEKQYDNNSICINTYNTDNSLSSMTEKESDVNETEHSESIVFEETDNNVEAEKKERKRQKSFTLDLNKKSNTRNSTKMFLYIQMQLCQRLSLREWLKQHTSARDFSLILNIFQQIVNAVEYVHLQGLIHRDLKPSNIFFAYDNKIKIGDFGLVTAMTEGCDRAHTPATENENVSFKNTIHTACVGTHLYMSPEQMNGQIYNYKVDIFSLGVIFFELLTPFFTDMERVEALSNLKKSIFPKDFAENYPAECNLLKMMLDEDPTKRPTTLDIKAKPPLQNYKIINSGLKWHSSQLTRHSSISSSISSSSSNNSFEVLI